MTRIISALLLAAGASAESSATYSEALKAFQSGRYGAARTQAEQLLRAQPDRLEVQTLLALAQAATGQCASAEPRLAVAQKGTGVEARLAGLALAQCQAQAGQVAEATSTLQGLSAARPDDADVLYAMARLQMRAFNETVQRMFEKTPASYRVNQLSGEILENEGRHGDAAAEYRKAIAKNAQAPNLHYRLGRALLLSSQDAAVLEEAAREFEAELKVNPEDAAAEYQIAQIRLAQGRRDEAARRYERALQLRADFPEAMLAVAKLRLQERPTEAVALLERLVQLQPRNEGAYYSLMLAYRNSGQTEQAKAAKERLDRLQRPQQGEFDSFLKRIGEKPTQP